MGPPGPRSPSHARICPRPARPPLRVRGSCPAPDAPGRTPRHRDRGHGALRLASARPDDLAAGDGVGAGGSAAGRPEPTAVPAHQSVVLSARGARAGARRGRPLHLRAGAVGRLGAGRARTRPQSLRPVRTPHAGLRTRRPGTGVAQPDLTAARQPMAGAADRVRLSRLQRGLRDVRMGGRGDRRPLRGRLPRHPGRCVGHPVGHVLRPDRGHRLGPSSQPPARPAACGARRYAGGTARAGGCSRAAVGSLPRPEAGSAPRAVGRTP